MVASIRVLQIEDNPADARLIRELIAEGSSMGFTWEHVERLTAATDLLRVQPFDLVLLDLSLPDSQVHNPNEGRRVRSRPASHGRINQDSRGARFQYS